MATLVTVKVYSMRVEAEVAKGLLEAHNIQSFIAADDAGGMRPFPMSYSYGVELKVAEEDLEKAKKILDQEITKKPS